MTGPPTRDTSADRAGPTPAGDATSARARTGPPQAPDPAETTAAPATTGTSTQALLSGSALTVFRLNGQFLSVAEDLARPAGLTAAWWQVLGAVLHEPLPVSGVARTMGITRQSVQRIADLLVGRGLAVYLPNPAHRRAKLLAPTDEGRTAIGRIAPQHAEFGTRLAEELGGEEELAHVLDALRRLSGALDVLERSPEPPGGP